MQQLWWNECLYQSVGQTDEDFQMDDALLDRAAHKQSQSHVESRERQLAIIGLFFCVLLYFNCVMVILYFLNTFTDIYFFRWFYSHVIFCLATVISCHHSVYHLWQTCYRMVFSRCYTSSFRKLLADLVVELSWLWMMNNIEMWVDVAVSQKWQTARTQLSLHHQYWSHKWVTS